MNKTLYLIFICLLLCAGTHLVAQTFDYNRVSGHPRLLMKQGEEQQIRESLKDNLEMQRVYKQIVGEALGVAFSLNRSRYWLPRADRFFKPLDE